jgi:hypothetical protein
MFDQHVARRRWMKRAGCPDGTAPPRTPNTHPAAGPPASTSPDHRHQQTESGTDRPQPQQASISTNDRPPWPAEMSMKITHISSMTAHGRRHDQTLLAGVVRHFGGSNLKIEFPARPASLRRRVQPCDWPTGVG